MGAVHVQRSVNGGDVSRGGPRATTKGAAGPLRKSKKKALSGRAKNFWKEKERPCP